MKKVWFDELSTLFVKHDKIVKVLNELMTSADNYKIDNESVILDAVSIFQKEISKLENFIDDAILDLQYNYANFIQKEQDDQ